jgi:hypothetical protein
MVIASTTEESETSSSSASESKELLERPAPAKRSISTTLGSSFSRIPLSGDGGGDSIINGIRKNNKEAHPSSSNGENISNG